MARRTRSRIESGDAPGAAPLIENVLRAFPGSLTALELQERMASLATKEAPERPWMDKPLTDAETMPERGLPKEFPRAHRGAVNGHGPVQRAVVDDPPAAQTEESGRLWRPAGSWWRFSPPPMGAAAIRVPRSATAIAVTAVGVTIWRAPPQEVDRPPRTGTRRDVVLPAPPRTAPAPISGTRTPRQPAPASAVAAPPRAPAVRDAGAAPVSAKPDAGAAPVSAVPDAGTAPPMVLPLTGAWTFSEQVREDKAGIDCTSSGVLDMKVSEGLLDGSIVAREQCRNAQGIAEVTAMDAELAAARRRETRWRSRRGSRLTTWSQPAVFGSSMEEDRRALAGDVKCEVKSRSSPASLSVQGTWRATRKQ